jgi:3D (Asp-Asp-Asp) domain-containing protein
MSTGVFCLIRGVVTVAALFGLAACGSTPLPPYEPPLARTSFQNVRTTAYTHTESDHLAYGNHNALGGTLRAAGAPSGVGEVDSELAASGNYFPTRPASGVASDATTTSDEARRAAFLNARSGNVPVAPAIRVANTQSAQGVPLNRANDPLSTGAVYGSAAADWSRWPAGTTFRIIPTGQLYKVDDYGFALSGRNTIDLYMPSKATMNQWGVKTVQIQILQWGDDKESLRRLRSHQNYRHIRRMVLELEGKPKAAAKVH